jgi:hypothetical protein
MRRFDLDRAAQAQVDAIDASTVRAWVDTAGL